MSDQEGGIYRPEFPDHWERRPLYDLARWVNGLAFREINFSPTGRPVIKIAELKNGISAQTKFTQQTFDDSVRVRRGDLLFSWSGQPETSIDAFWWRGPEGWLNQHLFRITPTGGVDRTFFYYLLRYLNPNFVGIARNKQTTGLGHVTRRDLEAIEAALPPLSEQCAIAEVLGALDDKIEANRRNQEVIEGLARALVSEAQEEAESVVPIGAIVERVSEIIQPSDIPDEAVYVGLEHVPQGSLLLKEHGTAKGLASAKAKFKPKDVLFGRLRPYFKKVVTAPVEGICSTDILVLRPKFDDWAVAVVVCSSDEVVEYASAGSEGTRMPRVSWEYLSRFEVPMPDREERRALQAQVAPLLELGVSLTVESDQLAAIRDALLPKLLSGELRVRDAETLVGEAV